MTSETHPAVRAAARTLRQWYGIEVPPHRMGLLAAELEHLGGREGIEGALERLLSRDRDAWDAVLDVMTIPESYVFRHFGHFALLRRLVERRRGEGRGFRVLSAGCSRGEEVWSAAAVLADVPAPPLTSDLVVGWDVSQRRLDKARQGRYGPWSVRAGLRGYDPYFHRDGDEWCASERLASFVRFERVNLVGALPDRHGPFDAVFFRNVGIYWSDQRASEVLRGLTRLLARDGLLLLGPSDPGSPDLHCWEHVIEDGIRYYRRRADNVASVRPALPSAHPAPPPRRRTESPGGARALRRLGRAATAPTAAPVRARLASPTRPGLPTVRETVPTGRPSADAASPLDCVRTLADAGQPEQALCALETMQAELGVEGRLWKGILLLALDRTAEAIGFLRQCVFLEPEEGQHRRWLAVAYETAGRTRDADREKRNAEALGTA